MSGSLTRSDGKMFPAFPAHAQPTVLRIWQEAHVVVHERNYPHGLYFALLTFQCCHDSVMMSQITPDCLFNSLFNLSIKQTPKLLITVPFVKGNHRSPVVSLRKGPVMLKALDISWFYPYLSRLHHCAAAKMPILEYDGRQDLTWPNRRVTCFKYRQTVRGLSSRYQSVMTPLYPCISTKA